MIGPGVWMGLSHSVFLTEIDGHERQAHRVPGSRGLVVIAGGVAVGLVAALAAWTLVMACYTLLTGHGHEGMQGLDAAAKAMVDAHSGGLSINLLRLCLTTATDAVFLLAFVALAALIGRHRLRTYITAAKSIRWRLLAVGLGLALIAVAPFVAADHLFGDGHGALPITDISSDPLGRLTYGLASLLLVPAAAAEELFFRGWLLRQVNLFSRRPGVLVGVTALVFAGLHFDFSPNGFLTLALMGGGFAYMTLRLGGIEFASGVHAANNILVVLFLQPLTGSRDAGGDTLSPTALIEDVALVGIYILLTEGVARWPWLRRLAGLSETEISPSKVVAAHCG